MTTTNEVNFEQSIRSRGAWLVRNESALKACQAFLLAAFWSAYEEENSEDLDTFLCETEDHIDLLGRTIADLRQQEFWPKTPGAAEDDNAETSAE